MAAKSPDMTQSQLLPRTTSKEKEIQKKHVEESRKRKEAQRAEEERRHKEKEEHIKIDK